eukprot:3026963-Prymnesium_polylepis.1
MDIQLRDQTALRLREHGEFSQASFTSMAHIGSQSRVVGAFSDGLRRHSTESQVHNRRVPELRSSPIRLLP